MRYVTLIRRATSFGVAAAGSLLSILLLAPSAFGLIARPVGDGSVSSVAAHPAPLTAHIVSAGGWAGWEVVLIASGAALLAATVAVFMDRARSAHRGLRISAP
jgi:hypothetical protein